MPFVNKLFVYVVKVGRTAVHEAVRFGSMPVVTYLIQCCDAAFNTTDVDGNTPLSDAYSDDIAKYLKHHLYLNHE